MLIDKPANVTVIPNQFQRNNVH